MKKTLFLTSFLLLTNAFADDVFVPQSIISVQQGESVTSATLLSNSAILYSTSTETASTTVGDVLGQSQQFTKNYSKRSAIVKDGQGSLEVDTDTAMGAPLLVREGTLVIKNATITNTPKSDGNNLSVSGVNAELVLDGGHYTQPMPPAVSYSSSVSIGAIDGDGTLTLRNGSSFFTVQTVFTGGSSNLPMPDAEVPAWNVNPHSGGSYAAVDTNPSSPDTIGAGNSYYRYSVDDAGFQNPFTTPSGSRLSTATVNVLSGSTLQSGTGFYIYNTTLNIDGEDSVVQTGTRNNSDNLFIGSSYGTTSVVNITNGGHLESKNNQYVTLSYYEGQQTELNISGAGAAFTCTDMAYVGSPTGGTTDVRITDGGKMHFDGWYYMRGAAGSHKMMVCGEGSSFEVGAVWQIAGADIVIADGAHAEIKQWQTVDASHLTLRGGATMSAVQGILGKGSQTVVERDSSLSAYKIQTESGATLINRGTLAHYVDENGVYASKTYLYGGSRLQTGEALISGCEGLVAEGHDMHAAYSTGLGAYMSLCYGAETTEGDSGTITLGALLTGKDEMQYLSGADLKLINNTVLSGLNMAKTEEGAYVTDEKGNYVASNDAYTITFKHEIGKNITLNYTTDDLNNVTGTESIAVNGGAVLVEQGQGEHHVGTLGSYVENAAETKAAVAVSEDKAGSKVTWRGDGMTTVEGEHTKLISGTTVIIGTDEEKGTLSVANGSTLENGGTIDAAVDVEQGGTLKGSGTQGSTTVQGGGRFVVGNSPGAPTIAGDLTLYSGSETVFGIAGLETPATATLNGWESAAYSQITITSGGVLSLEDGARFIIEFGGPLTASVGVGGSFEFDVTLVQAGEGAITLSEGELADLMDRTAFRISADPAAHGEGYGLLYDRAEMLYFVQANGSELHLSGKARLVPEPAAATLSLLALAALAARRRRK